MAHARGKPAGENCHRCDHQGAWHHCQSRDRQRVTHTRVRKKNEPKNIAANVTENTKVAMLAQRWFALPKRLRSSAGAFTRPAQATNPRTSETPARIAAGIHGLAQPQSLGFTTPSTMLPTPRISMSMPGRSGKAPASVALWTR